MPTLLGVFERPDQIAAAARKLRDRGYTKLETFSPAPFPEVDDAVIQKPSPVRLYTLVGGLLGVVAGTLFATLIAAVTPLPARVSMTSVIGALTLGASVGVVFGVVPAGRAARLDPIDALRAET